jgi:hypothetical protein
MALLVTSAKERDFLISYLLSVVCRTFRVACAAAKGKTRLVSNHNQASGMWHFCFKMWLSLCCRLVVLPAAAAFQPAVVWFTGTFASGLPALSLCKRSALALAVTSSA